MTEVDIAKRVIRWLMVQNWEVYQEIQFQYAGNIADIVAVQNKKIWILEVKKSFSLNLLEQAMNWQPYAHWVSIAVPYPNTSYRNTSIKHRFLQWQGIGMLYVKRDDSPYSDLVDEQVEPKINRKALTHYLLDILTDEHKTYAEAGNSEGRRYTPFQSTSRAVVRAVKLRPGITLKELLEEEITTHYHSPASARHSIVHAIDAGWIKGVMVNRDRKAIRLYPDSSILVDKRGCIEDVQTLIEKEG